MLQLWKQQQSLQQQTAEGLILKDSKLSQTFRSSLQECADTIALWLTCIKLIRDLQIISVGQRAELRRDKQQETIEETQKILLQDAEITLKSNVLLSSIKINS